MPRNRATARNDREKTVISSIVCWKTSTENHYFQHSMLRKPVRKFPLLLTRKTSSIVNKAYNGEKKFFNFSNPCSNKEKISVILFNLLSFY